MLILGEIVFTTSKYYFTIWAISCKMVIQLSKSVRHTVYVFPINLYGMENVLSTLNITYIIYKCAYSIPVYYW